ncbi:MAG: PHB depolymerase [Bdellovibrionales bacterium]
MSIFAGLLWVFLFFNLSLASVPPRTAKLRIAEGSVTVSGVSSGAFMAVQMHVAHSEIISGSASVAGGVYGCARTGSASAQLDCMSRPSSDKADDFIEKARELESTGAIGSLENLRNDGVLIFSSLNDSVVKPKNADRLENFFKAFLAPAQLLRRNHETAAHGFPTLNYGNPCDQGKLPWLMQCQLDLAGEILSFLYESLEKPASFVKENLKAFSQVPFGSESALMKDTGWVYLPTACQQGEPCRLHVAFHGCQMSPDYIKDQFAVHAGYNEWAESNRIVVLYPQATKSPKIPQACWDWFGATGAD